MVTEVQFDWYVLILVIKKIKQKRLTSIYEYKLIKKCIWLNLVVYLYILANCDITTSLKVERTDTTVDKSNSHRNI